MSVIVKTVVSVEPLGDNLSVVTTSDNDVVLANRKEDGSFRWSVGEVVGYVSEGSILPDALMKDRGYWDDEKDRGLLSGGKRNRVKMIKLGPPDNKVESRGLLFKVIKLDAPYLFTPDAEQPAVSYEYMVKNPIDATDSVNHKLVQVGDDVTDFFGIEEFKG